MDTLMISGICRCCASEGPSKDLTSRYSWMGDQEIYSKMLLDCFDISLLMEEGSNNGGICEVCITQLRNAFQFKKQVQLTEDNFKKNIRSGNVTAIKLELVPDDATDSEPEMHEEHLDDSIIAEEFEVPIKRESSAEVEEVIPKKRARASTSKAALKSEPNLSKGSGLACPLCPHRTMRSFNLTRHLATAHGTRMTITGKLLCASCGKIFSNAHRLNRHLTVGCAKMLTLKCTECITPIAFERRADFLTHMRRLHWAASRLLKHHCPLCDDSFRCHKEHDSHLFEVHNVELDYQELTFDSEADMQAWIADAESKEGACYLKRLTNDGGEYFHCYPESFLGHVKAPSKSTCPARIEIKHASDLWMVTHQTKHLCAMTTQTETCKKSKTTFICPVCEVSLNSDTELRYHISVSHDIEVHVQHLNFNCHHGAGDDRGKSKKKLKKKKSKSYDSATPERTEHRVNLTCILQCSTASPFRDKTAKGFSCLYCAKYFKHIDELRAHTAQQQEKDKLNSMIDYKLSYNPIKVDITDLKCTLCTADMTDLNALKDHLVSVHNKTINREIKDIILPFRLNDGTSYKCIICSVTHMSFKNLYQHMSSHYSNCYCNKCGVGYITIAALRKHMKTHEEGSFPCEFCDKVYTSKTKKRNHEKGVHKGSWLRNKCPQCPEIFVGYYDRLDHMVRVHNETPIIYPCMACNKVYKKKFELNRHIKHHHLQQKSFMCSSCNAKFFSKRGLADHLSRHLDASGFTCDTCGKVFSRYRTLKDHMRIHEEDHARYQCEVCKRTFSQKASLKNHVRLHQDDMDIFKEFDDVKHLIDNRDLTLKQIAAENKKKVASELLTLGDDTDPNHLLERL